MNNEDLVLFFKKQNCLACAPVQRILDQNFKKYYPIFLESKTHKYRFYGKHLMSAPVVLLVKNGKVKTQITGTYPANYYRTQAKFAFGQDYGGLK